MNYKYMPVVMVILMIAAADSAPAAGPKDYKINQISLAQGLSQSSVTSIMQDRRGFMWFGTADGLNQYDGYKFTHYKYDPADPASLSNNLIMAICQGTDGALWVGTRGMLNRFDPQKGTFTRYAHNPEDANTLSDNEVRAICQDRKGMLWVATVSGLNRMDVTTGRVTRYLHDPFNLNSLSHNTVLAVHEDRQGNIWAGTTNGLNRLDPATGRITRYSHNAENPASLSDNTAWAILEDHRGKLWVGTTRGLNCLDSASDSFENWFHDPDNPESLGNDFIRDIMEDSEGRLWVATWGGGITRLEINEDGSVYSFTVFRNDPEDVGSLSGDRVACLFQGHTGIIWAGLDVLGLNTLDENAAKFQNYNFNPKSDNTLTFGNVSSLYEDRDRSLWIGTWQDGLNRLDRSTGKYTHYLRDLDDPKGLNHNQIASMLEDSSGAFWVGGEQGLSLMDREKGTFTNFVHDPRNPDTIGQGAVWAIHEDRDGILRLGLLGGGLNEFDRESGRFIRYDHDEANPKSISSNFLRTIYQDQAGRIWVGTFRGGLNLFQPGPASEFIHYRYRPEDPASISHDMVLAIRERADHPGILWVGTHGGGLNRFDVAQDRFERYTEQNSDLPSNVVYGILDDDLGQLWLSTNKGIASFKPELNRFQNYDVDDGLQSKEFNQGAYFKGTSGELFFGGINGFNAFYPREIGENNFPPQLAFTEFKLSGEPVQVGGNSPLKERISETEEIVLSHSQNDISIGFVALHYSRPEANLYRYMLKPYDDDWSPESNQRTATYTNLDSGIYTFMMKASNNDGIWNEEGISLRLIIKPPWWRTVWAYFLYAAALISLLVMADRLQRRRVLRAERARAQMQESKLRAEAEELKTRAMEAQSKALQAEKERNELERVALASENARKSQEKEEARQLQLSMLPRRLPVPAHLDIAVFMETASEVGGDYYDFHQGSDGALTVAIGDATGQGLRAGTMVAATKSLFNALADEPDPVLFLKKASQYLKEMGFRKMYMAFLLAKVRRHEMVLACAGMPSPLIYRARRQELEEIPLKGLPLGSIADYPYESTRVPLEAGDLIFLMSDGIQELCNPQREKLGTDRLRALIEEAADKPLEKIIDHLVQAGKAWSEGRPAEDDVTFVLLKVK